MTESYHKAFEQHEGRGGFIIPAVDLSEPLSPTDFTDFFRNIWTLNDPGLEPFPIDPYRYRSRHISPRNFTVPTKYTLNQPAVIFGYDSVPQISSEYPRETFDVWVPPMRVGPLSKIVEVTYRHNTTRVAGARDDMSVKYRDDELAEFNVPKPGDAVLAERPERWQYLNSIAHYIMQITEK